MEDESPLMGISETRTNEGKMRMALYNISVQFLLLDMIQESVDSLDYLQKVILLFLAKKIKALSDDTRYKFGRSCEYVARRPRRVWV